MSTPSGDSGNQWGQPQGWVANSSQGAPPPPPPWAPAQPQWGQSPSTPWHNGPSAFQAAGGLGTAVVVLSGLTTALYWLSALLASDADRQYEVAIAQGLSAGDVFTAYDLVGLFTVPVMLAAWIVTCLWLSRARANALVLSPGGQRRSTVWVWLGWLVPVVSLWFPRQILDDTVKATAPAVGLSTPMSTSGYWAAWIVMLLLNNAQVRLSMQLPAEDAVMPALEFVMAIATTVAFVLWMRIVREMSAVQDQLAARGALR